MTQGERLIVASVALDAQQEFHDLPDGVRATFRALPELLRTSATATPDGIFGVTTVSCGGRALYMYEARFDGTSYFLGFEFVTGYSAQPDRWLHWLAGRGYRNTVALRLRWRARC
jgi:hypothetical protein